MSRSFKKHPVDKVIVPDGKRISNRKVRRAKSVPNGCAYRKVYNPYDVIDDIWHGDNETLRIYFDNDKQEFNKRFLRK